MSEIDNVLELVKSKPATWVEVANKEITELQAAAKADPKTFYGNRVRGAGDGLSRVKALLPAAKELALALGQLDRVL